MLNKHFISLLFALFLAFSTSNAVAQLRIAGKVTDSLGKPVDATIFISNAHVAGFYEPRYGTFDSALASRGRFSYTLKDAGAYFLCIRAKVPKFSLDIPFVFENKRADSCNISIQSTAVPVISATSPYDYLPDAVKVHALFSENYKKASKLYSDSKEKGENPSVFNDSLLRRQLLEVVQSHTMNIEVRRLAANYISNKFPSGAFTPKQLAEYNPIIRPLLPFTSWHWSWSGVNAIGHGLFQDSLDTVFAMLSGLMEKNPVYSTREYAALNLLSIAQYQKKDSLLRVTCRYCEENFINGKSQAATRQDEEDMIKNVVKRYCDQNLRISVGKEIPKFDLAVLGSKERVSNTALTGRVYLIDFWGTWCSGCVREIPNLEELYKKYSSKGFTILSLTGEEVKKVSMFRQKRYSMPWIHIDVKKASWEELNERFETLDMFPNPILVGADGKILAKRWDAMGEKLQEILAQVYK